MIYKITLWTNIQSVSTRKYSLLSLVGKDICSSLIPRLFPRMNESDGSLVGPGNKARHLPKYTIILQHTPCNSMPEVDNNKEYHRFIKDDMFTKLEISCTGVDAKRRSIEALASPVVVGDHPP